VVAVTAVHLPAPLMLHTSYDRWPDIATTESGATNCLSSRRHPHHLFEDAINLSSSKPSFLLRTAEITTSPVPLFTL